MKAIIAAFGLLFLWSCAKAGGAVESEPSAAPAIGAYEVSASVGGRIVKGVMRITEDSLTFRSDDNCESRYGSAGSRDLAMDQAAEDLVGRNRITFGCGGATLEFDKRNPTLSAKWSTTVTVRKQRQVCASYVTRNGRQVCQRTETEFYEVPESRSGPIQVRRIP